MAGSWEKGGEHLQMTHREGKRARALALCPLLSSARGEPAARSANQFHDQKLCRQLEQLLRYELASEQKKNYIYMAI